MKMVLISIKPLIIISSLERPFQLVEPPKTKLCGHHKFWIHCLVPTLPLWEIKVQEMVMAMYRETFIHLVTISRSLRHVDCNNSRVWYLKIQNDISIFTTKTQDDIIRSQSPKTKTLKIEGERGTVISSEKCD